MGCLFSKGPSGMSSKGSDNPKSDEPPKQYSWDKREKVDPKDFTIDNLKQGTAGRAPGTVNGQQFIIQNCEDSDIYIFDHTATVSIDDCVNCRVFLGPIKTSVFVRDCKNCKLMVACQQFRTRDCQKLDVFLCCTTQPIIEATTGIKFGCFQFYYPELEEQFRKAELSVFNNNWSNIHDFTPVPEENNFTFVSQDASVEDYIPIPSDGELSTVQTSTSFETSLVPRTHGKRPKISDNSCLVVFFHDGQSSNRAKSFISEMKASQPESVLIQSKELPMQLNEAERVFGSDHYNSAVKQGSVIGFEYSGDNICQGCQEACVKISQGSTGLVFVSANQTAATEQIELFFSVADMQMNV